MAPIELLRRDPHRIRGHARLLAALGALVVAFAAFGVPGTSGAFTAKVTNSSDKAAVGTRFTCDDTFAETSGRTDAYFQYKVSSASSLTAASDTSTAGNNGTYQGTHSTQTTRPIACPYDIATQTVPTAWQLDGSSNYLSTSTQITTTPATFSIAIWFKTAIAGGYLVGFADTQTGAANSNFDRHVYVNTSGKLVFGSYNGTYNTVVSPLTYADGSWHQAIATMSASTGMALWVDGSKVASNAGFTTSVGYSGWWRIGYGTLTGWPGAPSNTYFNGAIRYVAVYKHVLSDAEIAGEYRNGAPA